MSYSEDFLKATKWTSIDKFLVIGIQLLKISILARLINKESFGLLAMAMLVQGLTMIFADLGISQSLFSKKEIDKDVYSTLYFFNLLVSLLLYIILFACAPCIAVIFEETALVGIIRLLGLNVILAAVGRHFQVYAQKKLYFKVIAIANIIFAIIGLVFSTLLAYFNFEVYALIYPVLIVTVISSAFYFFYMKNEFPLESTFKVRKAKDFISIGGFQAGTQIIGFFAKEMDVIIVSKFLSSAELGAYNLIRQFTMRIYSMVNSVVTKVTLPLFSSFSTNDELVRSRYIEVVKGLSLLNSAIYAFAALCSDEIILLMFGSSYLQYSLIFKMFCLLYFYSSVLSPAGTLVLVKGKTQYGLVWTLLRLVISLPLLYVLGMKFNLVGIVMASLIFSTQALFSYYYVIIGRVQNNISVRDHLESFFPHLIKTLIIFFICYLVSDISVFENSLVWKAIFKCLLFMGLFFIVYKENINKAYNFFLHSRSKNTT